MTIVRTNGTYQGTTVYGLGGLETTPTAKTALNGWDNPLNSDIVRKSQPDIPINQDKIDELKRKIYE
ncbi:MAG: hypothetical protein IKA19_04600 [Muribaculaceae bacterium]|nr:hypothetical protein [Muribaculaceae bacterium]